MPSLCMVIMGAYQKQIEKLAPWFKLDLIWSIVSGFMAILNFKFFLVLIWLFSMQVYKLLENVLHNVGEWKTNLTQKQIIIKT